MLDFSKFWKKFTILEKKFTILEKFQDFGNNPRLWKKKINIWAIIQDFGKNWVSLICGIVDHGTTEPAEPNKNHVF